MNARIVKWNPRKHAKCCIGCTQKFQKGDMAVAVGCVTLHYRRDCAEQYIKGSEKLGLAPDITIVSRAH